MIPILDKNYFEYSGRILELDNIAYLGFTNSSVEFYVKGSEDKELTITARICTNLNGDVNIARLKVFIDDSPISSSTIILDANERDYTIASFLDDDIHKIKIIKITEAAMSYAGFKNITIHGGDLLKLPSDEDNRLKVEFIGDSITCGSGVLGEPDSPYHSQYEDGMLSYGYLTAKNLNLNARYISVSGYGVYVKYDGDYNGVIPKIYPYTNYFIDETMEYDFTDFIPDLFVINLGTNDSGHLHKKEIAQGFVTTYIEFLHTLKKYAPNAKILCICGTLCSNAFTYIEEAVEKARKLGLTNLYTYQLPYHNVEEDGMASNHPSIITHEKDSIRLTKVIKEIMNL